MKFSVRDSPETLAKIYTHDFFASGERHRISFQISNEEFENPQRIAAILEYQKKNIRHKIFEKEQKVVTWGQGTTASVSSTSTWYRPIYSRTTTSATTSTTYTTTANTATSDSGYYTRWTKYTDRYFYRRVDKEEGLIYFDKIWIKKSDLTHAQLMQLKINEEWGRACREEARAETRAIRAAEERARNKAESKALLLLESFIGEEELEKYKKTGQIYVKGRHGLYLAKKGGGISKIEGNKIINFCVYTDRRFKCPPTDDVIALKAMLEHDDKKIIKIANRMSTREVKELPLAACM